MLLTKKLEDNKKLILQQLNNAPDVVVRDFLVGKTKACLMYIKGISNINLISEYILRPSTNVEKVPKVNAFEYIKDQVFMLPEYKEVTHISIIGNEIIKGATCVIFENCDKALVLIIDDFKERALTEPPTSAVMKGPREGFNENIKTNVMLIRRILATPNLVNYSLNIGVATKTRVCVMYLKNIANKDVVHKIISKLKLINIDGVIDSNYVAEFLQERKKTMFKQIGFYEKPDIICSKMLEGRVAILIDGSPIVLTLPFILLEDFQAADDYYTNYYRTSVLRVIRIISVFLTILLPGVYIATQLYHYRTLPLKFIVTILNSTKGLPFTPFSEIMLVIVLFEILYEASLRMPKYLGLALSIVGALILGDTAVKAGLISPPTVMVVAVSGISIYTLPEQASQLSMLRIIYAVLGGLLGFYGLMLFSVFIIVYLSDFNNYGAPYLAPIAPKNNIDTQDAVFKSHVTNIKYRPKSIPNNNSVRQR